MKRKCRILSALLLLMLPVGTVSAGTGGQTTVTYQVDPVYEVEIPTTSMIPFQTSKCSYGKIIIREALLEQNKCIRVTLDSDGVLKNQEDSKVVIPYRILEGDKTFTGRDYTRAGEETNLTIAIAQEDWNRATSGEYTTSVVFKISYVDKE